MNNMKYLYVTFLTLLLVGGGCTSAELDTNPVSNEGVMSVSGNEESHPFAGTWNYAEDGIYINGVEGKSSTSLTLEITKSVGPSQPGEYSLKGTYLSILSTEAAPAIRILEGTLDGYSVTPGKSMFDTPQPDEMTFVVEWFGEEGDSGRANLSRNWKTGGLYWEQTLADDTPHLDYLLPNVMNNLRPQIQ